MSDERELDDELLADDFAHFLTRGMSGGRYVTPPPDKRPYHPAHLPGDERTTHTDTCRQIWRQVGWHGRSGAFYALGEDPSRYEPGSFAPLWLLVDDEPVDGGEDTP